MIVPTRVRGEVNSEEDSGFEDYPVRQLKSLRQQLYTQIDKAIQNTEASGSAHVVEQGQGRKRSYTDATQHVLNCSRD